VLRGRRRKVARPKVKGVAVDFGDFGLKQKRARIGRRKWIKEKGLSILKRKPAK
jgi:hypothetical protein